MCTSLTLWCASTAESKESRSPCQWAPDSLTLGCNAEMRWISPPSPLGSTSKWSQLRRCQPSGWVTKLRTNATKCFSGIRKKSKFAAVSGLPSFPPCSRQKQQARFSKVPKNTQFLIFCFSQNPPWSSQHTPSCTASRRSCWGSPETWAGRNLSNWNPWSNWWGGPKYQTLD